MKTIWVDSRGREYNYRTCDLCQRVDWLMIYVPGEEDWFKGFEACEQCYEALRAGNENNP